MLEAEVVGEFAGYVCRYTPTIMSGPVFRWSPTGDRDARFEVSASRDGVMVGGGMAHALSHLEVFDLVQVLDLASCTVRWLSETRENTTAVKAKIKAAKPAS